jgi:hypothetical protein
MERRPPGRRAQMAARAPPAAASAQ